MTVVYRRWRYFGHWGGFQLVVTREYKRVMKKFYSFVSFNHRIVPQDGCFYRDGAPYDVVDIEISHGKPNKDN